MSRIGRKTISVPAGVKVQINASTLGGVRPVDPEEARRARDFLRTDRIMNITFDAWTRRANRLRQGHKG